MAQGFLLGHPGAARDIQELLAHRGLAGTAGSAG